MAHPEGPRNLQPPIGELRQDMRALVLVNSLSEGYAEARELILPHLDHLGVPCELLDLAHSPLPEDVSAYALTVVGHRQLDPRGTRLGQAGRGAILAAVKAGCGLVSFDPTLPAAAEVGLDPPVRFRAVEAEAIEFARQPHYITACHAPEQILPLTGALRVPPMAAAQPQARAEAGADAGAVLLRAGGVPLLWVARLGSGRLARWATSDWLRTTALGPMAGLDDVLWRSLVWAARKPFVMRGLAPLVTMRVDDVAARGERWGQPPLYWAREANRHGFKPWLGLFIYNLTESAVGSYAT